MKLAVSKDFFMVRLIGVLIILGGILNSLPVLAAEKVEVIKEVRFLYLTNEFEKAKVLTDEFLQNNPNNPEALLWRGKIAFILREPKPGDYFTQLGNLGKEAVPVLLSHVKDEDARVRVQVYFQLAGIDDPRRAAVFLDRLRDEADETAQKVLLLAMGYCDERIITERLFWVATQSGLPGSARNAAVNSLANIASRRDTFIILARLAEYFDQTPVLIKARPVLEGAAMKIGLKKPQALIDYLRNSTPLKEKSSDFEPDSYLYISQAAYKLGEKITPDLIKAYQEETGDLKFHFLRIISRIEDDETVAGFLAGELNNPDEMIRRQALVGLAKFDTRESNLAVSKLLDNPKLQAITLRILAENSNIDHLEDKIEGFLEDADNYKRLAALKAMTHINPRKHTGLYAEILEHSENKVARLIAIEGIGNSKNPDYAPNLVRHLNDPRATAQEQRTIIDLLRFQFMAQVTQRADYSYEVKIHKKIQK